MALCGVEADAATYGAAIGACEKGQQWERAVLLLVGMDRSAHRPNAISFQSTISACENGDQWEQALCLFARMRQRHLPTDVITFNAAISAFEKGRQWEAALLLLATLRRDRQLPDAVTLATAAGACERARHWRQMLALLLQARSLDPAPPAEQAASLSQLALRALAACERQQQWQCLAALRRRVAVAWLDHRGELAERGEPRRDVSTSATCTAILAKTEHYRDFVNYHLHGKKNWCHYYDKPHAANNIGTKVHYDKEFNNRYQDSTATASEHPGRALLHAAGLAAIALAAVAAGAEDAVPPGPPLGLAGPPPGLAVPAAPE
ncbi:unnamed protein product, partial [Prorocentrum cordatum]